MRTETQLTALCRKFEEAHSLKLHILALGSKDCERHSRVGVYHLRFGVHSVVTEKETIVGDHREGLALAISHPVKDLYRRIGLAISCHIVYLQFLQGNHLVVLGDYPEHSSILEDHQCLYFQF